MKVLGEKQAAACTVMLFIFGAGSICADTNEWTSVSPEDGPILAFAIDPHNPATTDYSAIKNVNGGACWTEVPPALLAREFLR